MKQFIFRKFDQFNEISGDFYTFFNIDHPSVAWAIQRGMLVSTRYCNDTSDSGFISMMMAEMIRSRSNNRIFNEIIIENYRNKLYKNTISRIKGIYAFNSKDVALSLIGDSNWPEYFEIRHLSKIKIYCKEKPSILDSNWITCAKLDINGKIDPNNTEWIDNYFSGIPMNDDPLWEVLFEGIAIIEDTDFRRECYLNCLNKFPNCEPFLIMSRLASEVGTLGGLVSPFLTHRESGVINLDYVLRDIEFHDLDVLHEMVKHSDFPYLAHIYNKCDELSIPDFRPYGGQFKYTFDDGIGNADPLVFSVHS